MRGQVLAVAGLRAVPCIDFTEENKRVPYAVYTIKSESILPVTSYREFSGKKLRHHGFDHLYSSA